MGYSLKNRRLETAGGAVIVPTGGTSGRPSAPVNGQIRFNTDSTRFEIYYSGWKDLAIIGNVTITKDAFTGDGSTAIFTMSVTPASQNGPQVYVGNVHQEPGSAYTIASSNITFSSPPALNEPVEIYHGFDSTDAN
jgi:hypothetical protein